MNTSQTVSILLVDDEPRYRAGLFNLLSFYNMNGSLRFEVVGETASLEQAFNLTVEQHPALLLLDLELSPGDCTTTLNSMTELSSKSKVLILSAHREDEWVFRAMQAGACGYVFKDYIATELYEAIATVINNQIYLSPEVATQFFRLFHFYTGRSLSSAPAIRLTEREQEVLQWLVKGASNEQIAQELYITVATVKAHLTAIFDKLGVNSRTQAIVKALKLGLVCP